MNIDPIKISDLSIGVIESKIKSSDINFEDLKPGWLFKTNEIEDNVYLLLDKINLGKLCGFNKENSMDLIDSLVTVTKEQRFRTIVFDHYGGNDWWVYKEYSNFNISNHEFNINTVYETSINLDELNSYYEIVYLYEKYNLNELRNI